MKRILAMLLAAMLVLSMGVVAFAGECADPTTCNHEAAIGNVHYATIMDAIKEVNDGETVVLLKNATVNTWDMFWSGNFWPLGQTTEFKWNVEKLTIDGNNYKLKVDSVSSNGNGKLLFRGVGYLEVKNLTLELGTEVQGIGINSGIIDKVRFIGGANAIHVGGNDVTIRNCTFENQSGYSIENESAKPTGLVIENNVFKSQSDAYAVILRNNEVFSGNTVESGIKVNVAQEATNVSIVENKFAEGTRLKIYNAAKAEVKHNQLLGTVVANDTTTNTQSTLTDNYWGENRTPASVLGDYAALFGGETIEYFETVEEMEDAINPPVVPEVRPDPCDHKLDANGKCERCGVVIITYTDGKPAQTEEANPNTGAESAVAAVAAVAVLALAGAVVSKK